MSFFNAKKNMMCFSNRKHYHPSESYFPMKWAAPCTHFHYVSTSLFAMHLQIYIYYFSIFFSSCLNHSHTNVEKWFGPYCENAEHWCWCMRHWIRTSFYGTHTTLSILISLILYALLGYIRILVLTRLFICNFIEAILKNFVEMHWFIVTGRHFEIKLNSVAESKERRECATIQPAPTLAVVGELNFLCCSMRWGTHSFGGGRFRNTQFSIHTKATRRVSCTHRHTSVYQWQMHVLWWIWHVVYKQMVIFLQWQNNELDLFLLKICEECLDKLLNNILMR